jgi:hypothetical protein
LILAFLGQRAHDITELQRTRYGIGMLFLVSAHLFPCLASNGQRSQFARRL